VIVKGANLSYTLGWVMFRCVYRGYCRRRIYHPERVPLSGPLILAANHASFIDPPLVGSSIVRPISYLARESLFRFPGVGALLRSWSAIPVDRDGRNPRGMKVLIDRIKAGAGVVLFPEGTRTRDGELQSGKSGIGLVVIKTEAPVVPVRVFGTFEAFGRDVRFPRPHPIAVKYGYPIEFADLRTEAKGCSKDRLKEIYQDVADQLMERIAALQPCEDVHSFGAVPNLVS
jgi:1-acyl-sn-glycerol-3-phosphate acyltransferase